MFEPELFRAKSLEKDYFVIRILISFRIPVGTDHHNIFAWFKNRIVDN
jgi:hypothetical protein